MNKEQVKGRYEFAKGTVKVFTGKLFGKRELELKGNVQKTAGKVQAGLGDSAEDMNDPN